MGVLNVTPDSFSDGGRFASPSAALAHAKRMVADGADIVDVGGESSRPGADPVSEREELRRVLPIVRALAKRSIRVSVDTTKSAVADAACDAGAWMLNDITGSTLVEVAARRRAGLILMHMRGTPATMQEAPRYRDVVREVIAFLRAAVRRALDAGLRRDRIFADPGIGFGKTFDHNLEILRRLAEFRRLGVPLAVGTSRKAFIGHVLGRPVDDRLAGTMATVAAAVLRGAALVRVHDVREARDVVRLAERLR
jgi:dihydropteroate synthase